MNKKNRKKGGESADILAEKIEKLKLSFPDVFSNGKVNLHALEEELGEYAERGRERYRFIWPGKSEARRMAKTPCRGMLRPCPEESLDWENTRNLFIEGDNLEVLKLLQKSYRNKIKTIYIDPPYNTGNHFVYSDNFRDSLGTYLSSTGQKNSGGEKSSEQAETSGRLHANWLNMIYPRLMLARNLLRDDGAIFISIDDNEFANLKKVCDEIFGEENFLVNIIVQSNKRGQTYKQISKTHEYLLVYSKNEKCKLNQLEKTGDRDDLNFEDQIGKFNIRELRNRNPKFGRHNRPNLFYEFYIDPKGADIDRFCPVSLEEDAEYAVKVLPLNSKGAESCWRWGKELVRRNVSKDTLESNLVARQKKDGHFNIYEKYRKTTYKAKSIWFDTEVITEQGTVELGKLGLGKVYEFPKPKGLLRKVIEIGCGKSGYVLDFFAGSCTTAHAVFEQNMKDNGKRRFIMVQSPEPCGEATEGRKAGYRTIADIGKDRIRRAVACYGDQRTVDVDLGFKVFKLDFL